MSYLTGKNWYYNAWLGDPNGLKSQDLLEVVRFEKGGTLKNIEFGGRREFEVGTWTSDGNRIELNYHNGEPVVSEGHISGEVNPVLIGTSCFHRFIDGGNHFTSVVLIPAQNAADRAHKKFPLFVRGLAALF